MAHGLQRQWRGPVFGARMAVVDCTLDLELIAQRVLKLAEIATLEHLQGLMDSQAEGVLVMAGEMEHRRDADATFADATRRGEL